MAAQERCSSELRVGDDGKLGKMGVLSSIGRGRFSPLGCLLSFKAVALMGQV